MENLQVEDGGNSNFPELVISKDGKEAEGAEADGVEQREDGVTEIESLCMNCHEDVRYLPLYYRGRR